MSQRRRATVAALCALLLVSGLALVAWVSGFGSGDDQPKATAAAAHAEFRDPPGQSGQASPAGTPAASASASASRSVSPSTSARSGSPKPSASASTAALHPDTRTVGKFGTQILTGSSAVALTFDDGPDTTYTPQVLDLLRQHGVKATFCVIGSRARDYPDLVRRIAAEGHTLCNHSWQHLIDLGKRDHSYLDWDLRSTNDAIRTAVPGARIPYFRAPGGNFTQEMIDLAASLGMTSLNWDVDPRDWDSATYGKGASMVNHIVTVVQQTVRPGSVVLSHDRVRPDTVTAYRTLLPWLKERYELIAL